MKHNRFAEISGADDFGHAKANIVIQHNLLYQDGTSVLVQEHVIYQKPLISVFRSPQSTDLCLHFESNEDADLNMAWQLLMEYSDPTNSLNWTAEEVSSGFYMDDDGNQQPIYFHSINVILIPLGHEEEYQMHGFNPLTYTLRPSDPKSLIPNVLQITFGDGCFTVLEQEDTPATDN